MSDKQKTNFWNELSEEHENISKVKAESFLQHTNDSREGITARKEKFIKDLNTGSPKVLPANKRDNY